MSLLLRRLCTRRTFQIILNNNIKNSFHQKSNVVPLKFYYNPNLLFVRYKSKSSKRKSPETKTDTESDEEKDEDPLENINDKHTKTLNINVPSMRVDALLKTGLGLSRNKIETNFYSSNIRVNGEKIAKKSVAVQEGDEIDLVKNFSPTNPDFLVVARLEILSVKGLEDTISVKIRRCKNLTIENYESRNAWSPSSQDK